MIHAKEIRIGNIIWESSSFTPAPEDFNEIIVASINDIDKVVRDDQENGYSFDMLYGIPMTPEWLNKLDIKFSEGLGYSYPFAENFNLYLTKRVLKSVECTIMQYSEGDELLAHIKYVHQFQNLYFALTGEELTIKEIV